ncbi:MAG: RHS repeat-associated core domain-containing protein [Alphaproteobacteria bacterium]|nr:MAG: RHS repeat-associated core domain-containing protein [Alphaproteobacteria bacterium]
MAGAQGGAKQAYCGSLGHRKDDETGLVYMRARYYDPQVGRFTSEDPARHGQNWFAYCSNDPVNRFDQNGREDESTWAILGMSFAGAGIFGGYLALQYALTGNMIGMIVADIAASACAIGSLYCYIRALGGHDVANKLVLYGSGLLAKGLDMMIKSATDALKQLGGLAKFGGAVGAAAAVGAGASLFACTAALMFALYGENLE